MVCWIYWPNVILCAAKNINLSTIGQCDNMCRTQDILSTIFHTQKPTLTDNTSALRINNVIYASRTFQHFTLRWNCIRCRGVICFYNSNYILRLHLNVFGTKLHIYATDQQADSIIMHIPRLHFRFCKIIFYGKYNTGHCVYRMLVTWEIIKFVYCDEIILTANKAGGFIVAYGNIAQQYRRERNGLYFVYSYGIS